jgi:hypothetical protein
MRAVVVLLLAAAAALALAAGPGAKSGVVARLENPAVLRSAAGAKVTLLWTLRAGKQPFTGAGIYVRLSGRAGVKTTAQATELATGRFRARLTIPRGGVRSIVIALPGWRTDASGTRRADWRFPIVNDPTR